MCIKCITPVNISDGTKLNSKEYLYDRFNGRVYFLNHVLWHKFIYSHKLLGAYERYLLDYREKRNLYEWLQSFGHNIKTVADTIKSSAFSQVNVINIRDKRTVNDIICQARLADGKIFVPGSSIKGVIRTAVIYKLLQGNSAVKEKYWQEAVRAYNKRAFDKSAADVEKDLLHKLKVTNDKNELVKNNNAVCSVMRGISCSDAYSDSAVATSILQKIDIAFSREGYLNENKISVFRECIVPETVFKFTVKIDKTMLGEIGLKSIEDVLNAVEEYFKFVNTMLCKAFGSKYKQLFAESASANIYLGGGTGFLTKTILAALAPDMNDAVFIIKKLLDESFKKHNHRAWDKNISPRTLKATKYKNKLCLIGMAEMYKDE